MIAFLPSACPLVGGTLTKPFIHYQTTHAIQPCTPRRMPTARFFCRMRNRGGFRPPPKVPSDPNELQRAIELLGAFTQHKNLKSSRKDELHRLVGHLPPTRKVAQQWKVALQRPVNLRLKHLAQPTSFKNRKRILNQIRLPDTDSAVGRCFVLLGCLRRRHRLSQPVTQSVLEELTRHLGSAPHDGKETHHYIKALRQLQSERRSRELRPPQIPLDDIDEMEFARMLLGTFAVKSSVGKQAHRLERFLGTLPRNKNIAASWKKHVEAAIRKKRRKQRVALRRQEIELKRLQRRLKREKREAEAAQAAGLDGSKDDRVDEVRRGVVTSQQSFVLAPAMCAGHTHNAVPFIGRVRGIFGRILGLHPL
eukprot:GFKZ01015147.1.p1 GENE.GFKZ01015147.1~~GFKZ01015147.1.p1  ORF type:complete len:365 (-),score=35.30 GFKZ01015147.1:1271-2365(-)